MKPEKMDALLTLLGNVIEGLGREGLILQEKALAKLPIQRQWDINFYYKQFGRISPPSHLITTYKMLLTSY